MPWVGGDDRSAGTWVPDDNYWGQQIPNWGNAAAQASTGYAPTGAIGDPNAYQPGRSLEDLAAGYNVISSLTNNSPNWDPRWAAGAAGNFGAETGGFSTGYQQGGPGIGYGQWGLNADGSRGNQFNAYRATPDSPGGHWDPGDGRSAGGWVPAPIMSPDANLGFFNQELGGMYGGQSGVGGVYGTSTPWDAAYMFGGRSGTLGPTSMYPDAPAEFFQGGSFGYERPNAGRAPAYGDYEKRAGGAEDYYNYWASQQASGYQSGNYYGDYSPAVGAYQGTPAPMGWIDSPSGPVWGQTGTSGYSSGYGGFNQFGLGATSGGGWGGNDPYLQQFVDADRVPAAYNTLSFTVGGPSSSGGGGHWDPGDGRSPGGWVPGDAPSASSLNGFSSGNGYGVYGGGSGGNEYGYGGQSYSGPTGSDWAMNYGGGMSAADAAAEAQTYNDLQNRLASEAAFYSAQQAALPSSPQNYQSQIVNPYYNNFGGQIQGYNQFTTQYQSY